MKCTILLLMTLLFSCRLGSRHETSKDIQISNLVTQAEANIAASERNSKRLDSILLSINYIGTRDSIAFECQRNELLYYKTGNDKYRRKHNRLVDSIHRYSKLIDSILIK